MLLVIICTMCITSTEKARRKSFQLFATVHVIWFPLFIILMIVHGSDTWLNYGFPLGSITVAASLLIYLFFWVRKLVLQCRGHVKIANVEVAKSMEYWYLHLERPENYKHVEGQYAFFNCPEVSSSQWHPFSICSSGLSPHVSFLIKNSGDFTSKLIRRFQKCIEPQTPTLGKISPSEVFLHVLL